MKKYYIRFKTLGMTLCAGVVSGTNPDYIKTTATDLLSRRHVRKLDDAWIEDEHGNVKVVLNMKAYKSFNRVYEWLTLR